MSDVVLGLDISKKKFDAALLMDGKSIRKKFDNTEAGFRILDGWLRSLRIEQVHACLEATGAYGEAIANFLYEKGHLVSLVNPLRIKSFAMSDLQRNKTDSADAATIAAFCHLKKPDLWTPLPPEIKRLQELTRRIESLEHMLLSEKNRLELADGEVRSSLSRMISSIELEISEVKRLIRQHMDDHPDLKEKRDLLESIPGIGRKTAELLLGEIRFSEFRSARALAAHAGLTPQIIQSGTSVNRTRLSRVGNARVRKALYFPAIVAMKYNDSVKRFTRRLDERGKASLQVICAAMRKLLHIAFGVIRNNRPFEPETAHFT